MTRLRAQSAAAVILFVAALEVFGCALCSPDTCALAGTLTHQSHQEQSSGDDCLCCCGHILVGAAVHLEPSVIVAAAPETVLAHLLIAPHSFVYHPPRSLAL
jgi:hypothetical protein